jgi:Glycine/sarcosine/betaine reductase selenoprotein B (GRDB)
MSHDTDDAPLRYMELTRNYYRALGYEKDYVWARRDDVPFTRLPKPLPRLNVALIVTAGPPDESSRDAHGRRHVWSCDVDSPPATFDTDLAWDKESTHTDDRETFLPIDAMRRLVTRGVIGALAQRFHRAPTDYSHAKTMEKDAPELLRRLREDRADAALLTAL